MKRILTVICCLSLLIQAKAQDEEEKRGFKKENLFSGGSISLSFFNNTFLVGASPVLGYRLGRFADAGVVANIQYSSTRDYRAFNDRFRQTLYGGGLFTRLYPVNFLFAQAQYEYNFITVKYKPALNSSIGAYTETISGNSVLVGAGYCSGRDGRANTPFFYMSVLWDVSGNKTSPYTDAYGRSIPVIRAGFNIPLFQGRGGMGY